MIDARRRILPPAQTTFLGAANLTPMVLRRGWTGQVQGSLATVDFLRLVIPSTRGSCYSDASEQNTLAIRGSVVLATQNHASRVQGGRAWPSRHSAARKRTGRDEEAGAYRDSQELGGSYVALAPSSQPAASALVSAFHSRRTIFTIHSRLQS